VTLVLVLVLVATACGNSEKNAKATTTAAQSSGSTAPVTNADLKKNVPSTQPGVTDSEIQVGGVVAITNPVGGNYGAAADGVRAYFAMVNSKGGIYGRKLVLKNVRDDKLANNQTEMQALVSQDNVFAAIPLASPLFTGAQTLTDAGVPGFGWNINPEYTGRDNLFGQTGSLCWTEKCPAHFIPWLAKQAGAEKVGILGFAVPQAENCATAQRASYEKFGGDVVTYDTSLSYGVQNLASQVSDMKSKGVQFVSTCMDGNTTLTLAKEMKKQGLDAPLILPNAYDQAFVAKNAEFLNGSYVAPQFVPFESRPKLPAMQDYDTWMAKGKYKPSELSMIGWIDADEFYTGLKLAGPEFTRQKVIDGLNTLTAYDAGGLIPPIDWTTAHKDPTNNPEFRSDDCRSIVQIVDGKFKLTLTPPGKPVVCFKRSDPGIDPQFTS